MILQHYIIKIIITLLCQKSFVYYLTQLTYVDLAVYNLLRGAEFQFPEDYKSLPIASLRAFKERIQERPNIAAYLKSDRAAPFSDSMS